VSRETKEIVSVSLGSSRRDSDVEVEAGGYRLHIRRIGTDGDARKALDLIAQLDGDVDCFGLGGGDRYLVAGHRRYEVVAFRKLAWAARRTPVVDGSGFKETLEPFLLRRLVEQGQLDLQGRETLLVSAVDRPGMARTLPELGARVTYGDLIFAVGVPIPLHSLRAISVLGMLLLPVIRRMPMSVVYPTGHEQESSVEKYNKYFWRAQVVAGDFHFIRRYLPPHMDGRVVITNTITGEDVQLLRAAGISRLITTTPAFGERSFGTNVMEAVLVAISGRRPEELAGQDYLDLLDRLGLAPRVMDL
jgi:hypothetical protein